LLRETELPIAEIAHRTGYHHAEYLTVAFKRSFGMPPSEYRATGKSPR
jgi:LacI family transcriptional regulator